MDVWINKVGKFGLYRFSEVLQAKALGRLFDGPVCEMYPIFVDTPGLFDRRQITGKRLRLPVKSRWN